MLKDEKPTSPDPVSEPATTKRRDSQIKNQVYDLAFTFAAKCVGTRMSRAAKIAMFLFEASKLAPGSIVPWPLIAMAVFGLSKAPGMKDPMIQKVRNVGTDVARVMRKTYGLDVTTGKDYDQYSGVEVSGARATLPDDHTDVVMTTYLAALKRSESSDRSLLERAAIVDPKKVQDVRAKAWFVQTKARVDAVAERPKLPKIPALEWVPIRSIKK